MLVGAGFECGASLTRSTRIWQEPESSLRKELKKVEGSRRKGTKLVELQLPTLKRSLLPRQRPATGSMNS